MGSADGVHDDAIEQNYAVVDPMVATCDASRLAYFREYQARYYNDALHEGQGTEEILRLLARQAPAGDWLDIGAGPVSLFWALALDGQRRVWFTDLHVEALRVLQEFALSDEVPPCYVDAARRLDRDGRALARARSWPRTFACFNAFAPWPAALPQRQFALITEFGTFGLAPEARSFRRCFTYARPYLARGGRLIGANWVRSAQYVTEHGGANDYINASLIRDAADAAGFSVIEITRQPIAGDPWYDAVVAFALASE